jgi:putative glutamine amidotransferase
MNKPRIAVVMDENSSRGGTSYDTSKDYFNAVYRAGGVPFGIPYILDFADFIPQEFDGLMLVGGAIAFPAEWYIAGQTSPYQSSSRIVLELKLLDRFLEIDKPILGICHGMQILAAHQGCKLRSDVGNQHLNTEHKININPGTLLSTIIQAGDIPVNSRHREAVAVLSDHVMVAALSEDNVIESIEVIGKKFALGIQWHQENLSNSEHAGNRIFQAFVQACEHKNSR